MFSRIFHLKANVVENDKTRINTDQLPVSMRVPFGPLEAEDEISA